MTQQSSLVSENAFLFPVEIFSEILSWLEVKHLLRCKSVCKEWYAIIKNNQFVDMHVIRNGGRLNTIKRESESNNDGIKETIYCVCTCRGLLLEKILSSTSPMPSARYRLSNPSIKRILEIPDPHKSTIGMVLFLTSSTSSYNVVSIYLDEEKKYNLELLDLGGHSNDPCPNVDLSWRTLNISDFDKVSRQRRHYFLFCSCEDVVYILTLLKVGSSNPKIICYDLVNQACTTLNAPQSLHLNWKEVRFQNWRGKPSVLFVLEEKLNVWMLEDYKKHKWADMVVIPLPFVKNRPDLKNMIPYICPGRKEEILIYINDSKTCLDVYKLESKVMYTSGASMSTIPETLVTVKGMQPAGDLLGLLKT